jgi:DNA replication protein DnaC
MGERYAGATFARTAADGRGSRYAEALETCRAYAGRLPAMLESGRGLYLHGGTGSGKTHLAACIANAALDLEITVAFGSLGGLLRELRGTFARDSRETEADAFRRVSGMGLLVIDDFGAGRIGDRATDWEREQLYELVDDRYSRLAPVVWTSNLTIRELGGANVDRRVRERIGETCEPVDFGGESARRPASRSAR